MSLVMLLLLLSVVSAAPVAPLSPFTPLVPHQQTVRGQLGVVLITDEVMKVRYVTTLDRTGGRIAKSWPQSVFGVDRLSPQNRRLATWFTHKEQPEVTRLIGLLPTEAFRGVSDVRGSQIVALNKAPGAYVNGVFSEAAFNQLAGMGLSGQRALQLIEQLGEHGSRTLETSVVKRGTLTLSKVAGQQCRSETVNGRKGRVCTVRHLSGAHQAVSAGDIQFTVRAVKAPEGVLYRIGTTWRKLNDAMSLADFRGAPSIEVFYPSKAGPQADATTVQRLEAVFSSASRKRFGDEFVIPIGRKHANSEVVTTRASLLTVEDKPTRTTYITTLNRSREQAIFGSWPPRGPYAAAWYLNTYRSPVDEITSVSQATPTELFGDFVQRGNKSAMVFSAQAGQQFQQGVIGGQQLLSADALMASGTKRKYQLNARKVGGITLLPAMQSCEPMVVKGVKGQSCELRRIEVNAQTLKSSDIHFKLSARLPYALQNQARYEVGRSGWVELGSSIGLEHFTQGGHITLFVPGDAVAALTTPRAVTGEFSSRSRGLMGDRASMPMMPKGSAPTAEVTEHVTLAVLSDEVTQSRYLASTSRSYGAGVYGSLTDPAQPVIWQVSNNVSQAHPRNVKPLDTIQGFANDQGSVQRGRRAPENGFVNPVLTAQAAERLAKPGGKLSLKMDMAQASGHAATFNINATTRNGLTLMAPATSACSAATVDGVAGMSCPVRNIMPKRMMAKWGDLEFSLTAKLGYAVQQQGRYLIDGQAYPLGKRVPLATLANGKALSLFVPNGATQENSEGVKSQEGSVFAVMGEISSRSLPRLHWDIAMQTALSANQPRSSVLELGVVNDIVTSKYLITTVNDVRGGWVSGVSGEGVYLHPGQPVKGLVSISVASEQIAYETVATEKGIKLSEEIASLIVLRPDPVTLNLTFADGRVDEYSLKRIKQGLLEAANTRVGAVSRVGKNLAHWIKFADMQGVAKEISVNTVPLGQGVLVDRFGNKLPLGASDAIAFRLVGAITYGDYGRRFSCQVEDVTGAYVGKIKFKVERPYSNNMHVNIHLADGSLIKGQGGEVTTDILNVRGNFSIHAYSGAVVPSGTIIEVGVYINGIRIDTVTGKTNMSNTEASDMLDVNTSTLDLYKGQVFDAVGTYALPPISSLYYFFMRGRTGLTLKKFGSTEVNTPTTGLSNQINLGGQRTSAGYQYFKFKAENNIQSGTYELNLKSSNAMSGNVGEWYTKYINILPSTPLTIKSLYFLQGNVVPGKTATAQLSLAGVSATRAKLYYRFIKDSLHIAAVDSVKIRNKISGAVEQGVYADAFINIEPYESPTLEFDVVTKSAGEVNKYIEIETSLSSDFSSSKVAQVYVTNSVSEKVAFVPDLAIASNGGDDIGEVRLIPGYAPTSATFFISAPSPVDTSIQSMEVRDQGGKILYNVNLSGGWQSFSTTPSTTALFVYVKHKLGHSGKTYNYRMSSEADMSSAPQGSIVIPEFTPVITDLDVSPDTLSELNTARYTITLANTPQPGDKLFIKPLSLLTPINPRVTRVSGLDPFELVSAGTVVNVSTSPSQTLTFDIETLDTATTSDQQFVIQANGGDTEDIAAAKSSTLTIKSLEWVTSIANVDALDAPVDQTISLATTNLIEGQPIVVRLSEITQDVFDEVSLCFGVNNCVPLPRDNTNIYRILTPAGATELFLHWVPKVGQHAGLMLNAEVSTAFSTSRPTGSMTLHPTGAVNTVNVLSPSVAEGEAMNVEVTLDNTVPTERLLWVGLKPSVIPELMVESDDVTLDSISGGRLESVSPNKLSWLIRVDSNVQVVTFNLTSTKDGDVEDEHFVVSANPGNSESATGSAQSGELTITPSGVPTLSFISVPTPGVEGEIGIGAQPLKLEYGLSLKAGAVTPLTRGASEGEITRHLLQRAALALKLRVSMTDVPSAIKDGKSYCTLTSPMGQVAVPLKLVQDGGNEQEIDCSAQNELLMTTPSSNSGWTSYAANEYKAKVFAIVKMDDSVSSETVDEKIWFGKASAKGRLTASASME
ncbi:hypothetical protein [Aeromonas sp. CU5]|uniref:hypothetical protein n=1 Tax=Aeromonas sp. CU5 TaxID=2033033 RepID=UPI0012FDE53C|nr:hypothetical protein [Aeromonas sp. CU5]